MGKPCDEITRKGIACGGGIDRLNRKGGLIENLVSAHAVCAVFAQRQHDACVGIKCFQHCENPLGFGLLCECFALDFVEQKPIDACERIAVQRTVYGRGVEDDCHAALGSHAHDGRRMIQLVLQDEQIAFIEFGKHTLNIFIQNAHVFSGKDDDAVLSA